MNALYPTVRAFPDPEPARPHLNVCSSPMPPFHVLPHVSSRWTWTYSFCLWLTP